ncbi:MAG: acyl carrier protein [Paracoccus sp. (in: a-proteobacteria)]|uniref:acyl carrier protein n=1 Tax=Paracoccus sp. TaxID=267 RepID=UPI002E85B167|nr:acyl carrier protein [Pseudomonadota bacterium]
MTITIDNLTAFLKDSLNVDEPIDPSTELFSTGMLDSVAMMNVISFVEETARIEVHPRDVTLENFDSVQRIVDYATSQQ